MLNVKYFSLLYHADVRNFFPSSIASVILCVTSSVYYSTVAEPEEAPSKEPQVVEGWS